MRLGPKGTAPVARASVDPRRFHWQPRFFALLGRLPDQEVARRARVSLTAVKNERRRRRIPPLRKKRPAIVWTKAMIAFLGTDTDANVAAKLEINRPSVTRKRLLLGIPGFVYRGFRPEAHWPARALRLLGTTSDEQVARRLGLSLAVVTWKRRRLRIKSHQPPRPAIEWSARRLRLLGRLSDVEVSRRLGIDKASVKGKRQNLGIPPHDYRAKPIERNAALKRLLRLTTRELWETHGLWPSVAAKLRREYGMKTPDGHVRRWTKAWLSRLGKKQDVEIARGMGISHVAVGGKRRALGIPRWRRLERLWSEKELALLGRLPDPEIARRLRIPCGAVKRKRWELDIGPALARR